MINSHDTFSPLKEIIIGDVDLDAVRFADPRRQKRIEHIFKTTQEELQQFQTLLESRGIVVHRPSMIPNTEINTPYWSTPGTKIPLTPRDLFFILGNTMIESAVWGEERFFESLYFRDIMLQQFKRGAKWISMPSPRHDYKHFEIGMDDEVPNQDPIMDAPACLKYGKDVFVNTLGAGNRLGLQWLESTFGTEYAFHEIHDKILTGHLDSHFTILRPGLLITYHDRNILPGYFKNWDIIKVDAEEDKKKSMSQVALDSRIQDFDFSNTVLAVNCLSIDPNTVVMWDHYKSGTNIVKQFEKHGIEILFTPLTYSHFFNQGVTCVTLDLARHSPAGLIKY